MESGNLIRTKNKNIILCCNQSIISESTDNRVIEAFALGTKKNIQIPCNIAKIKEQDCFMGLNKNGTYVFSICPQDDDYNEKMKQIEAKELRNIMDAVTLLESNNIEAYNSFVETRAIDSFSEEELHNNDVDSDAFHKLMIKYSANIMNDDKMWAERFNDSENEIKKAMLDFDLNKKGNQKRRINKFIRITSALVLFAVVATLVPLIYRFIELYNLSKVGEIFQEYIIREATLLKKSAIIAILSILGCYILVIIIGLDIISSRNIIGKFSSYYQIQRWIFDKYNIETYICMYGFDNVDLIKRRK